MEISIYSALTIARNFVATERSASRNFLVAKLVEKKDKQWKVRLEDTLYKKIYIVEVDLTGNVIKFEEQTK